MKKAIVWFAALACLLVLLCGCTLFGGGKTKAKSYAEIMNEKIVSFTDCANRFSDSLDAIAGSLSAPSDRQIAGIEKNLAALEAACDSLAGQKAPAAYADAQKKLDEAMADYGEAFAKCRTLLDFFKTYDTQFRELGDPVEGSAEMEKRERALYGEFADAMRKAADSFRTACKEFSVSG